MVSKTPITRPLGHLVEPDGRAYVGPSKEMDVEIELAFFVGVPNKQFERIPIDEAEEHIFGVVMLNDWSSKSPV